MIVENNHVERNRDSKPLLNHVHSFNPQLQEDGEVEYIPTDQIYPDEHFEQDLELITRMRGVKGCTVLKYGIRQSNEELEYYYCKTCDINRVFQICEDCSRTCHINHNLKKASKMGYVKCACGAKLHTFGSVNKEDSTRCCYHEWAIESGIYVYYLNHLDKPVCMFCHNFCIHANQPAQTRMIKVDAPTSVPSCTCDHPNHLELKTLYEKTNDITDTNVCDMNGLTPLQIFNLIFKSHKSLEMIYGNFCETMNNLIFNPIAISIRRDFHLTNFFYSLKNFSNIAKSFDELRYVSSEIIPWFDTKLIVNLLKEMKITESNAMWSLLDHLLFVYHKVTIGSFTKSMGKYKLYDLENMSAMQRLAIFHNNLQIYPGSLDHISMFIELLGKFFEAKFTMLEGYDVLLRICSILKRLASFYLFNSDSMQRFCSEFDKFFEIFNQMRNKFKKLGDEDLKMLNLKEIYLFHKIMKMFHYFNYAFNDNIVLKHLTDKKSYPSVESITYENTRFLFTKIELGRLISRITIKTLSIVHKEYGKYASSVGNEGTLAIYEKVLRYGTTLLAYFMTNSESYMLSLRKSLKLSDYYMRVLSNSLPQNDLASLQEQSLLHETCYQTYFQFQINKNEVLAAVKGSLQRFVAFAGLENINSLELWKIDEQSAFTPRQKEIQEVIYDSNYFTSLIKVFKVIDFKKELDRNTGQTNIPSLLNHIYIFLYFFVGYNPDNAMIILSHYNFHSLTRIPLHYAERNFELFHHCIQLIAKFEGIVSFSKHILKTLYEYMSRLASGDLLESSGKCLQLFLEIMDMLLHDTKSLTNELTLYKAKNILINIFRNFPIIMHYQKFLYDQAKEMFQVHEVSMNVEEYNSRPSTPSSRQPKLKSSPHAENPTLDYNIFFLFLKLINKAFDTSLASDRLILASIFSNEDISMILKNTDLNINLRTELIRFFRKNQIDIYFSETKESSDLYIQSVIKTEDESIRSIKNNPLISNYQYPFKLFGFYESLIKIADNAELKGNYGGNNIANPIKSYFDKAVYDVLLFELDHCEEIIEAIGIKESNMPSIQNYFENALIIPLTAYMKRSFAFAHYFTGEEFLYIYEMTIKILEMKTFLSKLPQIDLSKDSTRKENNKLAVNKTHNSNKENNVLYKLNYFNKNKMSQLAKGYAYSYEKSFLISKTLLPDINKKSTANEEYISMKSKKFSAFDYTKVYSILENHLFSLLDNPKSFGLVQDFSGSKSDLTMKEIKSFEMNEYSVSDGILTDNKKRLLRGYFIYQTGKKNITEENSAMMNCLPEICLEYETTPCLRNLFIGFLIFLSTDSKQIQEQFSRISNFMLYKLLSTQTTETQNEFKVILKHIGELSSVGGMVEDSKRSTKELFDRQGREEIQIPGEISKGIANSDERLNTEGLTKEEVDMKLGCLLSFNKNLYKKLLSIFIEDFNPCDRVYSTDYILAYNIIKIFKFLCEEHNNFFQGHLIKRLSFNYKTNPLCTFFKVQAPLISQENVIANPKIEEEAIKFFDFMLYILNKILLVSKWEKNSCEEDRNIDYLFDIFSAILELLIEIIQGNKRKNLSYIVVYTGDEDALALGEKEKSKGAVHDIKHKRESAFQIFVKNVMTLLFHDNVTNALLFRVRTLLMNFFLAILEEKNCNEEVKQHIIENLNINKVLSSIGNTLKIYFSRQTKHDNSWTAYKDRYVRKETEMQTKNIDLKKRRSSLLQRVLMQVNQKAREYKLYKFDYELYSYFSSQYFTSDFSKSDEFEFANTYYRYIKIISVLYGNEEARELLSKVNSISEKTAIRQFSNFSNKTPAHNSKIVMPVNLINEEEHHLDYEFIERYFLIKFFEQITQTVQVKKDRTLSTVIFTVMPEMIYLSQDTKNEFVQNVNRKTSTSKTNDLLRNIDYFKKEIRYNSKRNANWFIKLLTRLNYSYVQNVMYLIAVAINLLMLFTLEGDRRIKVSGGTSHGLRMLSSTESSSSTSESGSASGESDREIIQALIAESVQKWQPYYKSITIAFVILCALFIIAWILAKLPLYYRIEKIKYIERHKVKHKSHLTCWNKLSIACIDAIYERDHITALLYMFVIGLICVCVPNAELAYCFLLLAIINLNATLKNIVVSVKMKYKELILTWMLAFFIIWGYSNIGFFFLNSQFQKTLDGQSDNFCSSLIFCFLTELDYGLRLRGGIGEVLPKVSFERNGAAYAGRFFHDVSFFLLIVILMLDLVFGIIIETFKELRVEEQHFENDKHNYCFICNVKKEKLEKDRKDFFEHNDQVHNMWNYVNYMISLKFIDKHELNAINTYTRENIDKKNIKWIPTYKDIEKMENNEEDEDKESESDFEIPEETHKKLPLRK